MSTPDTDDGSTGATGARRPSFQFYPGDWRNNANLGRCSLAARGAWIDVMCVLHDSEEYGVVRWPLKELANSAKVPLKLLRELADKGVLKGIDKGDSTAFVYVPRSGRKNGPAVALLPAQPGPIWFSSRMVKDEYRNTQRGKETRFGEGQGGSKGSPEKTPKASPDTAPDASPSQREGEGQGGSKGDGSSTSSSSSPTGLRDTVADATAAAVASASDPPAVTDREKVWLLGVPLLGEGGRGLLGRLAKECGDAVLVEVLAEATRDRPIEPKAWVVAACAVRAKPAASSGRDAVDILADPRPQWAIDAGFPTRFDAENAQCHQRNAHLFREGRRTQ